MNGNQQVAQTAEVQQSESAAPLAPAGSGDMFSLSPRNLQEAMQYADIISKTDLIPKDFKGKPGNVLVAVQMGAELGLKPTQALQNIAVVNGRPALWGDALLAIVKASPVCEYINEEVGEDFATCTVKRVGEAEVIRTFTMTDAKRAGLAGKQGPWTQYPKRMLQMRARSWAIRDVFPDLLRGINVAEEAQDIPPEKDITPQAATTAQPQAKPASRTSSLSQKLQGQTVDAEPAEPVAEIQGEDLNESALTFVLDCFARATTPAELAEHVSKAQELPEPYLTRAREAYLTRAEQLSSPVNS